MRTPKENFKILEAHRESMRTTKEIKKLQSNCKNKVYQNERERTR